MSKVKLKDIGKIITGCTPSKSDELNYITNDICFVKPSDIEENKIVNLFDSENYISEYARNKARILLPNSILVTCIGIIGKVAINKVECAFNQQINAIIVDEKKYNYKYVAYVLSYLKDYLQAKANAPVVPILNKSEFSEIEIPVPTLAEQEEIVNKLDSIEKLISARKSELDKLDLLIKAKFNEMFGDLFNPIFEIKTFNNFMDRCVDIGSNGSNKVVMQHLKMTNTKDYAFVVRFTNLNTNDFTTDVRYISKENYEFFSKSKVFGDEIIFCKIGSAGMNYIMPKINIPTTLGLNQIMITPKNINTIYLYYYINSNYGKFYINSSISGAVTKTITKHALWDFPIMNPPIELQNQFADFVNKVNELKDKVNASLTSLTLLKKQQMQKYFG